MGSAGSPARKGNWSFENCRTKSVGFPRVVRAGHYVIADPQQTDGGPIEKINGCPDNLQDPSPRLLPNSCGPTPPHHGLVIHVHHVAPAHHDHDTDDVAANITSSDRVESLVVRKKGHGRGKHEEDGEQKGGTCE